MDSDNSEVMQFKELTFTVPHGMTQSCIDSPKEFGHIEGVRIEGFGTEIDLMLAERTDTSLEELLATIEQAIAEQTQEIQWDGARKATENATGAPRVFDTFKKDGKSYYVAALQATGGKVFLTAQYQTDDAFAATKVRTIVESVR